MGRPKEHDAQTAAALLNAAERTIQEHGIDALSVRELALGANTTTRAVYSLFGSKRGLIAALGARAFALLLAGIDALPSTGDPRNDLIEAALMFRRFALEHPVLLAIGFQRAHRDVGPRFRGAQDALASLHQRMKPLADAGLLGGRSVAEAAAQFHVLCEGIASCELRGMTLEPDPEQFWREAVHALVVGFAYETPRRRRRAPRRAINEGTLREARRRPG